MGYCDRACYVILRGSGIAVGLSIVSRAATDSSPAELGARRWRTETDAAAVVGVAGSPPLGRLDIALGCPRAGVDRHGDADLRCPRKQHDGRR